MKISQNGIDFIAGHEGFRANAYDDLQPNLKLTASTKLKGTLTIGYGTIKYANGTRVKWNDTITKAKAQELLGIQVEQHCATFKKAIKVPLTQNQYDALASFSYNLGSAAITNNKTLLNAINVRNWSAAVAQMKLYNKAGGRVLQGLVKRRKAETDLFMKEINSSSSSKPSTSTSSKRTIKVAYCAGHGHNTTGKRTPDGDREWDFNNIVATAFASELSKYENVSLKRTDDPTGKTDIELRKRTKDANNWGADYYISFHHNANTSKWGSWTGVETFKFTTASTKASELAKAIHPALVEGYGLKDRGIKTANYQILRDTICPAILLEGGFMDSTTDIKVLKDSSKLKNAGKLIAQALAKHLGLKLKETKPSTSVPKPAAKKSIDKITKEVIDGKWGSGTTRKTKLKDAGHNYDDVQKHVNEILELLNNSKKKKAANDVIAGKYGSGTTRASKLKKAGFIAEEIQTLVNYLLA